jgi:hypothetical protein
LGGSSRPEAGIGIQWSKAVRRNGRFYKAVVHNNRSKLAVDNSGVAEAGECAEAFNSVQIKEFAPNISKIIVVNIVN